MPKSNNGLNKKLNKYVYFDYAASASANPSSVHRAGVEVKTKLQIARREVADILSARPEEIIFTSGGTESNNLAIQGVVLNWQGKILPHIITTNIEHPSVLETYKLLAKRKLVEITIVPVEANGIVDPKKIKKEIKKNTVLVSVMYANNEIGTIQPIKEIAKEIRHFKKIRSENFSFPLFHTDAVQAVNYLDLNVEKLGVDLLSLSGSKIEGASKVGVLYKKKTVKLAKVFGGGDQEGGVRPGTENLPEILKFSLALKTTQKIKEKESKRLEKLRDYFLKELQNKNLKFSRVLGLGPDHLENFDFNFVVNGDLKNRLPNNVNITFPNIPSDLLVIELSEKGIMASAKSACKSGESGGSYVIKAIRNNDEIGGVRFSLGRDTTKKDIDYTIKVLDKILMKLKKWY
ncbi:MAG: cysteine desulfurase family protein [Candidatus Paceibacterota bacterium]|jgi:cysteine desulfurase